MNIYVFQEQSSVSINSRSVQALVKAFADFHQVKFDEASIHFVDTPTMCDLHQEYFNDPSTTDCISFPMDDATVDGYRIMGEVFVCPKTAQDYVEVNGGDVYREISLYVVHGLLHLIGYDDIEDSDRELMRAEESRYLEYVSAKNLWIRP